MREETIRLHDQTEKLYQQLCDKAAPIMLAHEKVCFLGDCPKPNIKIPKIKRSRNRVSNKLLNNLTDINLCYKYLRIHKKIEVAAEALKKIDQTIRLEKFLDKQKSPTPILLSTNHVPRRGYELIFDCSEDMEIFFGLHKIMLHKYVVRMWKKRRKRYAK